MEQVRADLLGQGLVAMLATEQPDGRPHLAPIWFSWDGAAFEILTPPSSRKYQNLQRRPRCTISVDDRIWPDQALTARCDVDGTGEARGYPQELVRRYLSDELATSFLDDYGDPALIAVRLRPARSRGTAGSSATSTWTWPRRCCGSSADRMSSGGRSSARSPRRRC